MPLAIVTGGSSGLGLAIVKAMRHIPGFTVVDWSLETGVDVTDETSIMLHGSKIALEHHRVDVLVNCAGINQLMPIPHLTKAHFENHMAVNAIGILHTVRVLLPIMEGGTVCNVISNAARVPMRQSLAYCASKAAAEMMTKQMARELGIDSYGLTVFGVSPNRLAGTAMSKSVDAQVAELRGWSPEQVENEQRNRLSTRQETNPNMVAELIAFLLSHKPRHEYLHGCVLELGA